MKNSKWIPEYTEEICRLVGDHREVLAALYANAFNDGANVGFRNGLAGSLIGGILGLTLLCVEEKIRLKHKEQS